MCLFDCTFAVLGDILITTQLLIGCFFVMFGLYTPLSFFDITGTQLNLENFSPSLISIANSASLFGRLGAGLLGDSCGPINLLIPAIMGSAISVS